MCSLILWKISDSLKGGGGDKWEKEEKWGREKNHFPTIALALDRLKSMGLLRQILTVNLDRQGQIATALQI